MLDYNELYNSITNPLDDALIEELISFYGNGRSLYSCLTRVNVRNKKYIGKYSKIACDELYAKLFSIWKANVLSLTDKQIDYLISSGNVESDYGQLQSYLRSIPNIKTKEEFTRLCYYNGDQTLIGKYGWHSSGEFSGWTHVSTRYLTARKYGGFKVEHRLYLNTESIDTHRVASLFVDKCMKDNVPFYFKFDSSGNRDDTLVIYSDTKNLEKYISILREMKKENANLFSRVQKPPVLTGIIDNFIGYGSEVEPLPNGQIPSFNEIRAGAIEKGIKDTESKWFFQHHNDIVTYGGKSMPFSDYLAIKMAGRVIDEYKEKYELYYNDKPKTFYDSYGFTYDDLASNNLKESFEYYLKRDMKDIINKRKNGEFFGTYIPTSYDKKITIQSPIFDKFFREMTKQVAKADSSFLKDVKDAIVRESKALGIDVDKYCFDIASRDKLLHYSSDGKKLKSTVTFPSSSKGETSDNNFSNRGELITLDNICSNFDSTITSKKVKCPTGFEIPFEQYMAEYFYPFIPEDGFFTLKNGNRIFYKQYIEKFVINGGDSKYNGDLSLLLADTTRSNQGLIIIGNGNETLSFNPAEITCYLDPLLMKEKVKCPSGMLISAEQYIEEFFSSYIPENGIIILKNKEDISVKDFIEKIVMGVGQTEYNGDIPKIMEAFTRSNHGTVSLDLKKEHQRQARLKTLLEVEKKENTSDRKRKM